MYHPLSRRELLRGTAGIAIALPFLEGMLPRRASATVAQRGPVRLIWIHTESGMWMPRYKPTHLGRSFDLPYILEPLAPFRSELTVLTGLRHENAFKRNPQTGRHVQDAMCHLTGTDLSSTPGVAVRNGISIDQLAAETLGEKTRLPVLNLSLERQGTLSYTAGGTPLPTLWDPRAVFGQLFSDDSPEAKRQAEERFARNRSVLDAVRESTLTLNKKLGVGDRQKLDEYLTHVREVERRLQAAQVWATKPTVLPPKGTKEPGVVSERDRTAHARLLLDMLVLALQTDQTRLATMRLGFMSCQYPDIGCPDGYHSYTHHDFKVEKQEAMARVDRHRIAHLAYFLEKLRSIREGEHNLLHNVLIHYGAGMGRDHEATDLANLLIGQGGGAIKTGQHIDYKGQPLANLYVQMVQLAGGSLKRFADSTGPLEGI